MNSEWVYRNTCNVAEKKGSSQWRQTRRWDKKNKRYINLFDDIVQFCEIHSRYLQISTGLNHTQRDMVIVDVDEKVDPFYFGQVYLPMIPNFANQNMTNGRCQFYYILDKPVMKDSKEWKNLLNFSRKYGDDKFTGWQCRNPVFNGKSVEGKGFKSIKFHDERFRPDQFQPYVKVKSEGLASSSPSYMCKLHKGKEKVSPNKGKRIKGVGRNNSSFVLTGQWLAKYGYDCYDEKELFKVWKGFNIQVSKELGKEPIPDCEGLATCRQLLVYKKNNRLKFGMGKEANLLSQKIRKGRADKRLEQVMDLLVEGKSQTEMARVLGVSLRTVAYDVKKIKDMKGSNGSVVKPAGLSSSSFSMCKLHTDEKKDVKHHPLYDDWVSHCESLNNAPDLVQNFDEYLMSMKGKGEELRMTA